MMAARVRLEGERNMYREIVKKMSTVVHVQL